MSYSGSVVFKLCYQQPQASMSVQGPEWACLTSLAQKKSAIRFDILGYHEGFCLKKKRGSTAQTNN